MPQVTKNSINDTASPANPVLGYVAPASNVTYNGTAVPWIIYTLSPGSSCGLTVASGAWPTYTSTAPANGITTVTTNGASMCMLPITTS